MLVLKGTFNARTGIVLLRRLASQKGNIPVIKAV